MIDRDHRANFQCSAKGCTNTRDHGYFVGRFCSPCDAALVTGEAKNGTSWIFSQAARLRELEAQVESLQNKWATRPLSSEDQARRIEELEAALREMHKMVHDHVYRSGTPKGFPNGSRTIGPEVLGGINNILRDALGRNDESLKYFRFADDSASETKGDAGGG
jgi:hypothetical protein